MKKALFIFIGLMVFLMVGCGANDIPKLKATYNNKDLEVKTGDFNWGGTCTKSKNPYEIGKTMSGNPVAQQGQLKLAFSKKPDKVKVYSWNSDEPAAYDGINDNNHVITVPEKEGTYVFEIEALWKGQEYVSYVIKIIVSKK